MLFIQHFGNCLETHAAAIAGIDQANGFCRFGNNADPVRILVLEVAEGRCDDDAVFLLLAVAGADTAAAVTGIKVGHQPLEADDQIVVFVEGIDPLRGGKDPYLILPEVVNEQGCLGAMPSQPGQVFDHDGIDQSRIHYLIYFGNALPFEVHTADVVIEGFSHDFVAVADGITLDDTALITQRIEFIILVTGQAVVEPYSHFLWFPFCYGVGPFGQHTP